MYDSGVRSAADVFKALALGAKFVFVGRLWIWGLSIMGEHGVRHVMKSLLADFDILLNVSGHKAIQDIGKNSIGVSEIAFLRNIYCSFLTSSYRQFTQRCKPDCRTIEAVRVGGTDGSVALLIFRQRLYKQ